MLTSPRWGWGACARLFPLCLALLLVQAARAQTIPPYADRMNHVFGALNQTPLSTGILLDYGLERYNPLCT